MVEVWWRSGGAARALDCPPACCGVGTAEDASLPLVTVMASCRIDCESTHARSEGVDGCVCRICTCLPVHVHASVRLNAHLHLNARLCTSERKLLYTTL